MNVKPDVKKWLLEDNNPSAKYLAMIHLLGENPNSKEMLELENKIYSFKPCVKIFENMNEIGFWGSKNSPYSPKYKSSYWQVMILSQLGASIRNEKVKHACEFILSLQHPEGGFPEMTRSNALHAYQRQKVRWELRGKKLPEKNIWINDLTHESQLTCLTGNLLVSFLKLGYEISEPKIIKAFNWLIKTQNKDGGWLCPYWRAHIKDKHSCFLGTISPLDALSLVPEAKRTPQMKNSIKKGSEFLLMHHLYRADHHNLVLINPDWLKLKFPIFFYDFLRGLTVLARFGLLNDERAKDAISLLLEKQVSDEYWALEKTPKGRMYADFGKVGKPNKWVTINALRVVKEM